MVFPYYKRYPSDFLESCEGMSFEQKGAYSIILDLIYARDGSLIDDPRLIAGILNCSVRKWNALRSDLILFGKLRPVDGFLRNDRAEKEIISRRSIAEKNAENRSRPNKNNPLKSRTRNTTDYRLQKLNSTSPPDAEGCAKFRGRTIPPMRPETEEALNGVSEKIEAVLDFEDQRRARG